MTLEDKKKSRKAYFKAYREKNKERIKEQLKNYVKNNPDKIKANQSKWKKKNPDKIKVYEKKAYGKRRIKTIKQRKQLNMNYSAQIIALLKRGKDPFNLAITFNTTLSSILKLKEQI